MKILIAADLHWPTVNGVSSFSRNLAQGLSARGHDVLVIAPSQTGKRGWESDDNYRIARTNSVSFPFYQNFKISLSPQREVKRIIDNFKPDIIHIQMLMWIGQASMRYGVKHDIPVVTTNHAMPENLMDNLRLLAPLARPINYMLREYGARFHAKADYVTMPTDSAIQMFNAMDKVQVPMSAISNGIDLKRFQPAKDVAALRKRFNLPAMAPIITYVGRLDTEKHIYVLLRAFEKIQRSTGAHLLIVGSGNQQEELALEADELSVSKHVTMTGKVSDEDLVRLHGVGTVFCMPSPAELQSIATLEAMASGLPIVAVDKGALRELCQDGINGYLCPSDDVIAMAEALEKIITNPKLRDKMAKESLKIAQTHDLEYTLTQFEELYRSVITAKKALVELPSR